MTKKDKTPKGPSPGSGQTTPEPKTKRFFPEVTLSTRDRPTKGGAGSPWQAEVTDKDILYMIRRDELAFRIAMKWSGAVFNKGFEVRSDNDALKVAIDELFEKVKAKEIIKQGYLLAKTRGFCLIALGFEEAGTADASQDPAAVKGLAYLHAIPKTYVKEIIVEEDPTKDTFGEIIKYVLLVPVGDDTKEVTFPASRFVHFKNPFVDDNPEGISMFTPLYDKFVVKKNLDFAMSEVPYQMAVPLKVLYMPSDADEDEVTDAEEYWKNINARSYFILPDSYKAELMSTDKALNPEHYTDYVLSTLGSGSLGSKMAMLGTEAGALSTSETNQQEWFGQVADEQKNLVEPIFREIIKVLQFWKVLPDGDFWFEWNPLYETSEKESAETAKLRAETINTLASAITLMAGNGFELVVEDGETFFVKDQTKIIVPSVNILLSPVRKTKPTSREPCLTGASSSSKISQSAPYLPRAEKEKLFRLWEVKSKDIENRTVDGMQTIVTLMQTAIIDEVRRQWEKEMGPIGADPSMGKADAADLLAALENFFPKSLVNKLRKVLLGFTDEAYAASAIQTLENAELSTTSFRLEDIEAIRVLRREWQRLASQTYLDMHSGAMLEVEEGLRAGMSYPQINDLIATRFFEFSKGIPNTVHKFVHTVTSKARFETMKTFGQDKGVFSTSMDDRVRPSHAQWEGTIMTEDEAMPILSEFGCRCTTIPLSSYQKVATEVAYEERRRSLEEAGELI